MKEMWINNNSTYTLSGQFDVGTAGERDSDSNE